MKTMYTGNQIDYLLISLLLLVMFSIWNGLVNKQMHQDQTHDAKMRTSAVWHKVGVIVRFLLGLIAFISYGYLGAVLAVLFAYPVYDRLMNLVRGLPLNYYGESDWDKFAKKFHLPLVVAIVCIVLIVLLF